MSVERIVEIRFTYLARGSSINIARLIIVLERANIASFKSHEFYSNFSQPLFDYEIINFVRIENEALRCE